MLDLETLGTRPGCAILSIGAVRFDPSLPHGIADAFHVVVNTASCTQRYGLTVDQGTLDWWACQSDEARALLAEAKASRVGLAAGLGDFTAYVQRQGSERDIRLWGNGADFDPVILRACYEACGIKWPWRYGARCFRTLRELAGLPKKQAALIKHDALADATAQAKEAVEIMRRMSFRAQESLAV
jgi:hypothetical protein